MATLGAVLAHIGYKLAGPHKWRSVAAAGLDQLAIFTVTIVVTLASDLLIGIGAGMLTKMIILFYYSYKSSFFTGGSSGLASAWKSFLVIFQSPIEEIRTDGDTTHIYITGSLNCFNALKLRSVISTLPTDVHAVIMNFAPSVRLVDHSTSTYLNMAKEELKRSGRELEFRGLAELRPCSKDRSSLKYRTMPSIRLRQPEASSLISA
jgi:MFS superfamily sulfate permease-like transporter